MRKCIAHTRAPGEERGLCGTPRRTEYIHQNRMVAIYLHYWRALRTDYAHHWCPPVQMVLPYLHGRGPRRWGGEIPPLSPTNLVTGWDHTIPPPPPRRPCTMRGRAPILLRYDPLHCILPEFPLTSSSLNPPFIQNSILPVYCFSKRKLLKQYRRERY